MLQILTKYWPFKRRTASGSVHSTDVRKEIQSLCNFLLASVPSNQLTYPLQFELSRFKKLSLDKQLEGLPNFLEFAVDFVCDNSESYIDRTRFKGEILNKFSDLIEISDIHLINASHEEQEFYISKDFIVNYIDDLYEILGSVNDNILFTRKNWIIGYNYSEQEVKEKWRTVLAYFLNEITELTDDLLGIKKNYEIIQFNYDVSANKFNNFQGFTQLVKIIPTKYLGKRNYNLFSKNQLQFLLQEKIKEYEILNKDLNEKNEKLIQVQKEISERMDELTESHQFNELILGTVGEGIIVVDIDNNIVNTNGKIADIFGYDSPTELIGKSLDILIPHKYKSRHNDAMESRRRKSKEKFGVFGRTLELEGLKRNGKIFPISINITNATDKNGLQFFTAAISDITLRKRYEEKLKSTNEELENIVEERTMSLLNSNRELIRSNTELEHFAYIASHDLQEPLRTITSFLQLLEKKYTNTLDDNGKEYIRFVVDGAKRMKLLIKGLLIYSRVGRKEIVFKKTDLNQVVKIALDNLRAKTKERKLTIEYANLPEINGDRILLVQLFQNLIDNAMKFSENDPIVNISVEEKDNRYIIAVEDNGIGISESYFDKVFVIFQRLNPLGVVEGTGIGLSLCKKIVEKHNGEISLESTVGKGTVFYLKFPVMS